MNKKVIVGIIISVSVILLAGVGIYKSIGTAGGKAYDVKVAQVTKGDISSYISAGGSVEEVEKAEVYLDTPLKVEKVLVAAGDKVTKGQKLLELDISSLNSELEKLKTNMKIQELSMNSALSNAEVNRAQSALDNAQRNFDTSKKNYENSKELYSASAISKSELDMSENTFNQAEGALADARTALSSAKESRNVNNETANENLKITKMSIADMEKRLAAVEAATKSPMEGVVVSVNVEAGAFTSSMQPLFKVINPDMLQVRAKIKEYDTKNVHVGQKVSITGDAISKDIHIGGKISAISPVATVNRTLTGEETVVEVTVSIDDTLGVLKPGLNVNCDIYTVDKKDVVVIPMDMITEDKDGNKVVYVVDMEKKVMKETGVTLGINSDMYVEVLEGLKPGDNVILEPQPIYSDGAKVRISENVKK